MLEKGDRIRDYRLVKFLGRGQFGEVWLAEKLVEFSDNGLEYALKFLYDTSGQGVDISKVKEEVNTSIKVSGQQNINRIFEAFVEKGYYVIVSDYADNGSLSEWLFKNANKAPSIEKAVEMMRGILNGLHNLHSKSVVHRDLKPENILLHGEEPRISDFGTSRIINSLSRTNNLGGSPLYMSPESFLQSKKPCVDIWSAGVIFYQLLSGKLPFIADNPSALMKVIETEEPFPLSEEIPFELKKVIEKALQKDPSKRFSTAKEMLEAVNRAFTAYLGRTIDDSPFPEPSPHPPIKPKPVVNPIVSPEPVIDRHPEPINIPEPINSTPTPSGFNKKWLFVIPALALLFFAALGGFWLFFGETKLIPFRKGDKFGFSDVKKNIIIEPKYEEAEPFHNGMAKVKLNGKYGFIDQTGKVVIPFKYDQCDLLIQPDLRTDLFISKLIGSQQFKKFYAENENLISVKMGDKFGLIDKFDKEVIPVKYDGGLHISESLIAAKLNNKSGYIDKTGKEVIPFIFDDAGGFIDGIAPVMRAGTKEDKSDSKWGFIDKTGKEIIPLKYESVGKSSKDFIFFSSDESLILAKINGKFGFIDKTGKEIIPFIYDEAVDFTNGLAAVMKSGVKEDKSDDKWGFIDKSGKEVIPIKFEHVIPFIGDTIAAKLNGKEGYIDKKGNQVIPFMYEGIHPFGFIDDLAFVKINGKGGFIDKTNNLVIEAKYNSTEKFDFFGPTFSEGLVDVGIGKKKGYIDKTGKEIIPFKYDSAAPFSNGLAKVTLNGVSFYIDKSGTEYYERNYLTEPVNANKTNTNGFNQNTNLMTNTATNSATNSMTNMSVFNANIATNSSTITNSSANTYSNINTSSNTSNKLPYYQGKTATLRTNMRLRSVPNETDTDDNIVGVHYRGAKVIILEARTFDVEGKTAIWIKVSVISYGCDSEGKLGCGYEGAKEGWMNGKPDYISLN